MSAISTSLFFDAESAGGRNMFLVNDESLCASQINQIPQNKHTNYMPVKKRHPELHLVGELVKIRIET